MVKVPATPAGLPAIRAAHRRGHQHQHHAVVRAKSLRGGGGGLSRRPGAFRGERRRRRARSRALQASSSAASTPRSTPSSPSGCSRATIPRSARNSKRCAAKSPSPTQSSPIAASSASSPVRAGIALAAQRRAAAAPALGEHRHQEPGLQRRALRRDADRAAHGQHHAASRRWMRFATMAARARRIEEGVGEAEAESGGARRCRHFARRGDGEARRRRRAALCRRVRQASRRGRAQARRGARHAARHAEADARRCAGQGR